ncbi:hypothetical protein CDAR_396831 [Caerostris darwini]|uniref:Uncharacterized protein n=1 Tax=Caerostris darwini TaxID=1538125 RepID=A0AAV4QEJ0_9ARAC|nr:hypothetical protein CDAR_396831 [Caerostris darwini]
MIYKSDSCPLEKPGASCVYNQLMGFSPWPAVTAGSDGEDVAGVFDLQAAERRHIIVVWIVNKTRHSSSKNGSINDNKTGWNMIYKSDSCPLAKPGASCVYNQLMGFSRGPLSQLALMENVARVFELRAAERRRVLGTFCSAACG